MIYTQTSGDIFSFLLPDKDFALKSVIAMTYTLSAEHFIGLANCVRDALYGGLEAEAGDPNSDVQMSMRDICFDFDEISSSAKDVLRVYSNFRPESSNRIIAQNAFALYDLCGRSVTHSQGLFHPKLLLVCMHKKSETGEDTWRFRLQISSNNLTGSTGVELAVRLQGERHGGCPDGGPTVNGYRLEAFLKEIFIEADKKLEWLDALGQTHFSFMIDGEYSTTELEVAFNSKTDSVCILDRIKADLIQHEPVKQTPILVYSPFLQPNENGAYFLDCLASNGHDVLYHTNLTRTLFDARENESSADRVYASNKNAPFLHAKMLIWQIEADEPDAENCRFRVWLGSANASEGGMKHNTELMAGFTFQVKNSIPERYAEFSGDLSEHRLWPVSGRTAKLKEKIEFKRLRCMSEKDIREEDAEALDAAAFVRSLRVNLARSDGKLTVTLCGEKLALARERDWSVSLVPAGKEAKKRLASEHKWEIPSIPPGAVFLLSVFDKDSRLLARACIQGLPIGESADIQVPPPEPMAKLLPQLCAMDAIPRCAVNGFAAPGDSLYQRLCAYLCSHCWDGKPDTATWERLTRRAKKVYDLMMKPDMDNPIYFEEEDREQVEDLCEFLRSAIPDGGEPC